MRWFNPGDAIRFSPNRMLNNAPRTRFSPLMHPESSHRAARQGTFVATLTALILILVKLAVGFFTGTVVVIASAVDSFLDFVVSSFNVYAVRSSGRPSDPSYNYGR